MTMFLGFIFIASWMFSMSHKERILFLVSAMTIMFIVILNNEAVTVDRKVTNFIEVFFLSVVAFFFDAFDYNLSLSNFLKELQIKKEQEEIKRLENFKTRFFTNLTHELRTPLTIITGMANEIIESPTRWAVTGGEIIRRNAANLLNLVNQILDLSRIESGSMPIHLVRGDVITYIGYITDAFRGQAILKKIELHFLPHAASFEMDFDPDKYLAVLSNLISNAIKFTPEGGHVYIEVSVREDSPHPLLELIVKDTGIGIPPEEINQIFERFYQIDTEQSKAGLGTGLGLSLVRELVDMLGGEIAVSSPPGRGSQFKVVLPAHQNAPLHSPPFFPGDIRNQVELNQTASGYAMVPVADGTQSEKREILLIEDHPEVADFIKMCLEDTYHIHVAHDGQTGIDKAIATVPDLVLSDVLMPVKNGLEVCRELTQHPVTSHIPIVLLSAKADPESRVNGLASGADVFMVKPFHKEELRLQIRNLLERFRTFHERYEKPVEIEISTGDDTFQQEDEFVRKVRDAVMQNLDNSEFSVSHLERMVFLSRSQIHKKLKALTGLSASQFIRRVRLDKARHLLRTTSLTVADIAYQVGFSDPNYFTRCFTEEWGQTPTATRG